MTRDTDQLIVTDRLDLHLVSVPDLICLYEEPGSPRPWVDKPFTNPHRVLVDDVGPLPWRVPSVRRDPTVNRWLVRLVVLRSTDEVIGYIGFHDAPDEAGMIEVGVQIVPSMRRRGYATEALTGMWRWAVGQPGVRMLRYTVSPTNGPSVRIVEGFGFALVGRQIDEIDGPEDIYEMTAADFAGRDGAV